MSSTYNPSGTSANLALSNGNLTVNVAVDNANGSDARAIISEASGKWYMELTADVVTAGGHFGNSQGPGLCDAQQNLDVYMGSDSHGMEWVQDGFVQGNGVGITTIQAFVSGDTLCMAADLDNKKVWFRTNGGNWNNSSSANPASNSGGIDISFLGGQVFPAVQLASGTQQFTANFGGTAYARTIPSGFSSWGVSDVLFPGLPVPTTYRRILITAY